MKFSIDNDIRLSPNATLLDFEQKFPYAVYYLTGWVKNGETFEVYYNSTASDKTFTDMFGAKIPRTIQFSMISSTIKVVAEYHEFMVKLNFDMFEFLMGTRDTKACLERNCMAFVSPEAEEIDEAQQEATIALLRDVMISYWLGETAVAVA